MRVLSAYLLILILHMPLLVKLGVAGHWQYNRKQIAIESCVNKNNPAAHCNGKCQFRKWMQSIAMQESQSQNQSPFPHIILNTLQLSPFVILVNEFSSIYLTRKLNTSNFNLITFVIISFIDNLWLPPD